VARRADRHLSAASRWSERTIRRIADGHAEAVDAAIVIVAKRSSGRVNPRDWIVCRSASALIAGSRHESSRKSAAHPDDRD